MFETIHLQFRENMNMIITAAVLSLTIVPLISAQLTSIGCFLPGECAESLTTAVNLTSSAQECLEFCQVT